MVLLQGEILLCPSEASREAAGAVVAGAPDEAVVAGAPDEA